MFDRIRRSWALTKASWAVLKSDRELLVFPAISFVALVIVLFSFVIPLVTVPGLVNLDSGKVSVGGMVLTFVFYVVAYSVAFYFNTALVGAADRTHAAVRAVELGIVHADDAGTPGSTRPH
jgi:hypothetical protein